MPLPPERSWILADFNGVLEPDLLCLSHDDVMSDQIGRAIALQPGLRVPRPKCISSTLGTRTGSGPHG